MAFACEKYDCLNIKNGGKSGAQRVCGQFSPSDPTTYMVDNDCDSGYHCELSSLNADTLSQDKAFCVLNAGEVKRNPGDVCQVDKDCQWILTPNNIC
jgi:hypothetical protein